MLVAAARWESVATQLGQTISQVSRVGPLDVSRPSSEEAVRAVSAVVAGGGVEGPRVSRVNEPWGKLLGETVETETAVA